MISTTYKNLCTTVHPGYKILLKDGACTTEVLSVEEVSMILFIWSVFDVEIYRCILKRKYLRFD